MTALQRPTAWPTLAAVIALASLVVAALGIAAARCVRRSAPARHGVLMCALCVLALLPTAPFAAQQLDVDWLPRPGVMPSITGPGATRSASALSKPAPNCDAVAKPVARSPLLSAPRQCHSEPG